MWGKTAAIWLVLASAAIAQSEEDKKKEEEAKAKIADFKKELKAAKGEKDVARAIENLGALQHPKILIEIKIFLGKGGEACVMAAEQLGKYKKDKDAADALMSAATSLKESDPVKKCVRYAGDIEYKGIIPKLSNLFRHKDVDVAKEAVDSCGKIKSRDAIDPLLSLWKELDSVREEKASSGGGGGLGGGLLGGVSQNLQDEQIKRKRDLTPAVESALGKITGENFKDLRAANDWWRKNKATFKDSE